MFKGPGPMRNQTPSSPATEGVEDVQHITGSHPKLFKSKSNHGFVCNMTQEQFPRSSSLSSCFSVPISGLDHVPIEVNVYFAIDLMATGSGSVKPPLQSSNMSCLSRKR